MSSLGGSGMVEKVVARGVMLGKVDSTNLGGGLVQKDKKMSNVYCMDSQDIKVGFRERKNQVDI